MMNGTLEFLWARREEIAKMTLEHLGLTCGAVLAAVLVAVPLGIQLTRYPRAAGVVLGGVGVFQTIPSVALLGFLLPWLGLGVAPALVALFLYALLPIVRNTWEGIRGVDPDVREAALGMGMSPRQLLWQVEMPLAMPVIFAGIRTATVITVGVATLSALIASGGLGQFIFRGLALNDTRMVLAGAVPAALLALFLDGVLSVFQKLEDRLLKWVPWLFGLAVGVCLLAWLPHFRAAGPKLPVAGWTSEFMERSDGWRSLRQHYGLQLSTREMDATLMYDALAQGEVDVISGFSTDGRVEALDLVVLEDDLHFFPPYEAAPLVRNHLIQDMPEVVDALRELAGMLSNSMMRKLNHEVDGLGRSPREVAREFLQGQALRLPENLGTASPAIRVGGKQFTEQFLLAEIMAWMIRVRTGRTVEVLPGLSGTKLCYEALVSGDMDVYAEYSGTGLLVLLQPGEEVVQKWMKEPRRLWERLIPACRDQLGLSWLDPLGFENTYALMMRREHAANLGIRTISDLAALTTLD